MENTIFHSSENYIQRGFIVTIHSLFRLQEYLKNEFDLPYLLTSKIDNDHHESKKLTKLKFYKKLVLSVFQDISGQI